MRSEVGDVFISLVNALFIGPLLCQSFNGISNYWLITSIVLNFLASSNCLRHPVGLPTWIFLPSYRLQFFAWKCGSEIRWTEDLSVWHSSRHETVDDGTDKAMKLHHDAERNEGKWAIDEKHWLPGRTIQFPSTFEWVKSPTENMNSCSLY